MKRLVAFAAFAFLVSSSLQAGRRSQDAPPASLVFDPNAFTAIHITVDGAPVEVRRYRVVYVARPVKMAAVQPARSGVPPGGARGGGPGAPAAQAGPTDPYIYQTMYIYVPQRSYANSSTAIILQVNNGGWFASPAQDRITEGAAFVSTSDTDNTGAALAAGYVVVSAGTRSRGIKADDGTWAGKSPAPIVDAKAAVRYLRLNDRSIPGSSERIVVTGTSGGGALSVALAASGNSPDFYPELAAVGAAGMDPSGRSTVRDDIFGAIAYCPITDLGHADMAYEWQFGAVRTAANTTRGEYPPAMQTASAALSAAYPKYLESLRLKREDGTLLSAANLQATILDYVKRSVEAGIASGARVPALGEDFVLNGRGGQTRVRNEWLSVENGQVKSIDYQQYLQFVTGVTALKTVPAFDASANTGATSILGENTLFGPANLEYSNFAEYSWNHNEVRGDGSGPDDTGRDWTAYMATPAGRALERQIKMSSPMAYFNTTADSAPYWYLRHGLMDRDTAFAVEIALSYGIRNDPSTKDVNFKLAWLQGHAGNYDVGEAYRWLAGVLAKL
jgi:acetyl esterase/lipase